MQGRKEEIGLRRRKENIRQAVLEVGEWFSGSDLAKEALVEVSTVHCTNLEQIRGIFCSAKPSTKPTTAPSDPLNANLGLESSSVVLASSDGLVSVA